MNKPSHCCDCMINALNDPDSLLCYEPALRRYNICQTKGKVTYWQEIAYCPFCGNKFPGDLVNMRKKVLKKEHGIHNPIDDIFDVPREEVPAEFLTDEWWINRKL